MPRAHVNRESDRFMLRLPEGMRNRIRVAAEANNRSMNSEMVAALEEKYPSPGIDEAVCDAIRNIEVAIDGFRSSPPSVENAKIFTSLEANLEALRAIAKQLSPTG
ncbi:Arc family DNA-binding protein [Paracoccus sp. PAR01]|uniref:Arc family DNA-binding protein n=1 Tax=Paracoccus sp. PAR01 TaxID=2769282 RepID=UPI001CE120F4|nr:Arc family DNA-binding protein [Paracoccus sp. PAR01]